MKIADFAQRHREIIRPKIETINRLPGAPETKQVINPFARGESIDGIVLASVDDMELALLSIGSGVLGIVTGKNGLVAVDVRVRSAEHNKKLQIAIKSDTRAPRLDMVVSDQVDEDVTYRPETRLVAEAVDTALDPEEYLEAEVFPTLHPVTGVRPSYWTENRLTVHFGELEEGVAETLTIRANSQSPLGMFAFNQFNSAIFQSEPGLLDGGLDLSDASPLPSRLQSIPE